MVGDYMQTKYFVLIAALIFIVLVSFVQGEDTVLITGDPFENLTPSTESTVAAGTVKVTTMDGVFNSGLSAITAPAAAPPTGLSVVDIGTSDPNNVALTVVPAAAGPADVIVTKGDVFSTSTFNEAVSGDCKTCNTIFKCISCIDNLMMKSILK